MTNPLTSGSSARGARRRVAPVLAIRLHPALVGAVAALDTALGFTTYCAANLRNCGYEAAANMAVIDLVFFAVFTLGFGIIAPAVLAGFIAKQHPAARSAFFWLALTALAASVLAATFNTIPHTNTIPYPVTGTSSGWSCRMDL